MTREEIEEKIQGVADWYDSLEGLFDKLTASPLGLDPDCDLFETMWKLFEAYKHEVALAINDSYLEWISWFIYENECGRKEFTIDITDRKGKVKVFKIKNAKDMSKYLVWEREQNEKDGK